MPALIIILGTFLVCFLADKGFAKLFRSQPQHHSGKAVRLSKFYSLGGLILAVLGVISVLTGISQSWMLTLGGALILAVGIFLMVYYLTFGIFYDSDSFLAASFGKKSRVYRYEEIVSQQLYNNRGQILIELYMKDGSAVHVQSSMPNALSFMETAISGWCDQRGLVKEECEFYDPANCCWFPKTEA